MQAKVARGIDRNMSNQSIFRVKKKQSNYTIIDNTGPQDKWLSWGAKGLLTYMLTMPDNWTFHKDELARHSKDGIYKLRQYLKELRDYKYLVKAAVRDPVTKQIIKWETHVHELPYDPEVQKTGMRKVGDSQITEIRNEEEATLLSEKLECGKASKKEIHTVENRTLQSTNVIQSTNGTNKDLNIPFSEIILYLNEKAGTKYKPSTLKTRSLIRARFNDKFTLDDFKSVIDIKTSEWTNSDFAKYLRPETLFGNKFESYLNQKEGDNHAINSGYHATSKAAGQSITGGQIGRLR